VHRDEGCCHHEDVRCAQSAENTGSTVFTFPIPAFTIPILVFTMRRSRRSRSREIRKTTSDPSSTRSPTWIGHSCEKLSTSWRRALDRENLIPKQAVAVARR
jgi:hypothetical protein